MEEKEKMYTKEEVTSILKRRVERSHQAFYDRYGVHSLEELDELFKSARAYMGKVPETESKYSFSNVIGLKKVKDQLMRTVSILEKGVSTERHFNLICMSGESGTGKTLSAIMLSSLLFSKGILKKEKPYIVCADNVSIPEIDDMFQSNRGGMIIFEGISCLFETFMGRDNYFVRYNLYEKLDKYRNEVLVVFIDSKAKMDALIKGNKDLSDRVSMSIQFDRYTKDELYLMALLSIKQSGYEIDINAREELSILIGYLDRQTDFAGARTMRNVLDRVFLNQAERTKKEPSNVCITIDDFYKYEKEEHLIRTVFDEKYKSYEKQLDELIGLDNVKSQIKRLKAYVLKNLKKPDNLNLHMCFTGNPGTGKTEVAKLFAGILYENGILPENKLVQKDRSDLIAEYIGQTAPKVREAVKEALGGVLFIDEAYSLYYEDSKRDYGSEAIAELLKCMEDYRGQFAVIFAGYKNETMEMIESNPGLQSRINRFIDFPNYKKDELVEITKLMLKKNDYTCDDSLVNSIVDITLRRKDEDNFANAREVRNILECLYEIQSVRTLGSEDRTITKKDIDQYIKDNNISLKKNSSKKITENDEYLKKLKEKNNFVSLTSDYIEDRTVLIRNMKNDKTNGEGTGFIISDNGLIATNHHVIDGADEITIRKTLFLSNGSKIYKEYKADVIKSNSTKDVAIVLIRDKDYEFPYFSVSTAESKSLDPVMMGGYPLGGSRLDNMSFSEGRIMSFNKDTYLTDNDKDKVDRIYVDIKGVPGSSGSALLDKNTGEVIGIYSGASLTHQHGNTSELDYAMPIKYLWELIPKSKSVVSTK